MSNSIDLNNLPANHKVSLEQQETPQEMKVRLYKEVALFSVALLATVAILVLCVVTVCSAPTGSEDKKWAMSVLSAATAGIIGYLVRK